MFRLEKVFQNDDSGFIYFTTFVKTLFLFILIYCSAILQKNTVYDLFSIEIFKATNFYSYSLITTFFYLIICLIIKNKRYFKKNFISFLREDILSLIISNLLVFSFFFIFQEKFIINLEYFYVNLTVYQVCCLYIFILIFYIRI